MGNSHHGLLNRLFNFCLFISSCKRNKKAHRFLHQIVNMQKVIKLESDIIENIFRITSIIQIPHTWCYPIPHPFCYFISLHTVFSRTISTSDFMPSSGRIPITPRNIFVTSWKIVDHSKLTLITPIFSSLPATGDYIVHVNQASLYQAK